MRQLDEIAQEIYIDWDNLNNDAVPYLQAMAGLESIEDQYGYDSAREIVARFLCNANSWRGEVARNIKAELKAMLKK